MLDEESWLDIAGQLDPLHPYAWHRDWPPWGADAYTFAHPPGFAWWLWLVGRAGLGVHGAKLLAALPFAALYGWAAARIAARLCARPALALAALAPLPAVLLVLQRGAMPDLALVALEALAVAGFLEGGVLGVAGGFALAAAAWVKYPALLLAPVLLAAGGVRRRRAFWLAAACPWLAGEAWLAVLHGRPHLVAVLAHAGEVARGPAAGRALGVAARLALAAPLLPALSGRRLLFALPAAAALVALGAPPGQGAGDLAVLALWAAAGLVALAPALRPGAPPEDRVPALWALAVVAGVVAGHNFSAPRYLAPAALPLAVLAARRAAARRGARALLLGGALAQGIVAVAVTGAEHRFAAAADAVAAALAARHPEGGLVAGEWTFRWRLVRAGWTPVPGPTLPAGARVAVPVESSPPERPPGLRRLDRVDAPAGGGLRVVAAACGVGLYAETIGPLPLGACPGPLEAAELWAVPPPGAGGG